MPKELTCDKCGSSGEEDCEGNIFCEYHRAEHELQNLRREYKAKCAWVKNCWLSKLAEMRKEIFRLEKIVKAGKVEK